MSIAGIEGFAQGRGWETQKSHPGWGGFLLSLRILMNSWSLASQDIDPFGVLKHSLVLFELFRMGSVFDFRSSLPGTLISLDGAILAAVTLVTGTYLIAIAGPNFRMSVFYHLRLMGWLGSTEIGRLGDFGFRDCGIWGNFQCWQVGHQWVPRLARVMRRMGVEQTRQGRPVRR